MTDSEIERRDWRAGAAFKCIAVLIGSAFLENVCVRGAYEHKSMLSDWLTVHSHGVSVSVKLFTAALWLIIAFVFSRCPSPRQFINKAGLKEWPSLTGWLGALFGLAIGLFTLFAVGNGWIGPSPNRVDFNRAGAWVWMVSAVRIALLGPFCEETVVRGFLFKAFRGSYSFLLTTVLVLGFQIYFHWGLVVNDWLAGALFILTMIVLCAIRERTRSLWNCFLLHSAYNATIIRQWPIFLIVAGIVFAVCLGRGRPANMMEEIEE